MMKQHGCQACDELWGEYATATLEHIQLEGKLQIAELAHEHDVVQRLGPDVQASADRRTSLRQLIIEHEAQTHPEPWEP